MTQTRTRPGGAESGDTCLLGSERFPDSAPAQKYQAQNLVRRFGVRPPYLRVVAPTPPPRPRRLEVRISAADGRAPYGRSRPFRLTHDDLDELIAVALRIEGRRA
ncbi:MAG: hypothetical protein CR217_09315 [Beijerinckiaceae bacterium]|nr:MAG: hypothetical protein CR217_09315 [Beijerinckiaceae bacterium]